MAVASAAATDASDHKCLKRIAEDVKKLSDAVGGLAGQGASAGVHVRLQRLRCPAHRYPSASTSPAISAASSSWSAGMAYE